MLLHPVKGDGCSNFARYDHCWARTVQPSSGDVRDALGPHKDPRKDLRKFGAPPIQRGGRARDAAQAKKPPRGPRVSH